MLPMTLDTVMMEGYGSDGPASRIWMDRMVEKVPNSTTVTTLLAILFALTRSATSEVTVTTLVIFSVVAGVVRRLTTAVNPAGKLPSAQVTTPVLSEQLPWEAVAPTQFRPGGKASLTTTLVA